MFHFFETAKTESAILSPSQAIILNIHYSELIIKMMQETHIRLFVLLLSFAVFGCSIFVGEQDWYCAPQVCDGTPLQSPFCNSDRNICENDPMCNGLVCYNDYGANYFELFYCSSEEKCDGWTDIEWCDFSMDRCFNECRGAFYCSRLVPLAIYPIKEERHFVDLTWYCTWGMCDGVR